MTENSLYENLDLLKKLEKLPSSPEEALISKITNPTPEVHYVICYEYAEFSCLCPNTGLPNFAKIIIDYVPNELIVSNKSLELFLNTYRNHSILSEECTVRIGTRLVNELKPLWLKISSCWHLHSGMPVRIFYQTGEKPSYIWLPEPNSLDYK